MAILTALIWAAGLAIFLFGLQSAAAVPLTLWYERWKRRFFRQFGERHTPFVSVIVPAFNEEQTISRSVESILRSDYPAFEVIVVNDGSTDGTEGRLRPFIDSGTITCKTQSNRGKGSALNTGLACAQGEVIFYTDADSMFLPHTIQKMARWFVDPRIHAVCGNDAPLHPETPLQKLLAITTHIGTGFVRRAFSVMNVMPIISGNTGAVRREWLLKAGGFSEMWGEDLDLTFRLQRARARIVYDSDALVMCEVPGTLGTLWRQRVRWVRSYLKITAQHADMLFRPEYSPFSWYLPLNWFTMIGIPVLQVLIVALLPLAFRSGRYQPGGMLDFMSFLGYGMFLFIAIFSALLDRSPGDLKYLLLYGWLIIPISYFYNAVVLYSLSCEARSVAERWEKSERRHPVVMRGWRKMRSLVLDAGLSAAVVGGIVFFVLLYHPGAPDTVLPPLAAGQPSVTLATHFDAWTNPQDAVTSILHRSHAEIVTSVGIGAGRFEWNFFAWKGHEATWSNDQRLSSGDLLGDAVARLVRSGRSVVAIVDFYAPNILRNRPELAARDADGTPSPDQVCFTELVDGAYGKGIREMVTYLARHYDLEGISLTELAYKRYCYDERCRASYRSSTGAGDWPRTFFSGAIDRNDRSIGLWRSREMARFLSSIADSVHRYGKKLYIDVPVDYADLRGDGAATGLRYQDLLSFADGLIIWNYFTLDGRSPKTSEQVASYFVGKYGADRVTVSLGLWGKDKPVSPPDISAALYYSILGGARRIWITPNHLVTEDHWDAFVHVLDQDSLAGRAPPRGNRHATM